jgi:lysine-N-methylase
MQTVKVLVPAYWDKFICIGGACEANCCEADWKIFVDKNTYNLYRNIKDPDFKKELPNRIKRVKGGEATDHNYAYIVLDEKGHCSYLEDGMCSIQLKHGFKYLGVTCLVFPRKQLRKMSDGTLESALSMACPEAIRVGLYPEEPMTFKEIELERTHNKSLAALPPHKFDESSNVLAVHAVAIRQGCIDIMQTRSLPVSDRIFVIGMMLNKLREISDTGNWEHAPVVAEKYTEMVRAGQFDGLLASFADNEKVKATIKAKLFNTALSFVKQGKYSFDNFVPCVKRFAESLGKEPEEVTHLELSGMIEKGAAAYWNEFLEKRGHILENYFVNFIFGNAFPFSLKLGIQHQILLLAEAYALFRVVLCAAAPHDYGITDENIIKTICSVFRHSNHSGMINDLTENYVLAGIDSLAHISFMLRD